VEEKELTYWKFKDCKPKKRMLNGGGSGNHRGAYLEGKRDENEEKVREVIFGSTATNSMRHANGKSWGEKRWLDEKGKKKGVLSE